MPLILVLLTILPTTALAYDFEVDGIYYNINGTNAAVTDNSEYSEVYFGSVTIPATVTYNGTVYSVTTIGDFAFSGCSGLTGITIPNSVTSIGSSAFYGCSGLTSVSIPNSVTSIGSSAFMDCSGLTSISIPESVTIIGYVALSGCSGLTSISVESGNPNYDSRNNCNAIIETATNTLIAGCMNTTIPNSVTTIGSCAFCGCNGMTSIAIPESVTVIGGSAFYCCSGLTSVTIPNSVTTIGGSAFSYCRGLASIIVENGNPNYDSRNNCNAIIETATNTLFLGCMNTTIPNSVTYISEYAFSGCGGLTSITIPNSVTTIGDFAFSGCSGLTSVNIPNSVTSIGNYAFYRCSGLASVTIPNSITTIGDYVFYGCSGLTSVTIPNSVTTIGKSAFDACSGMTCISIPNSVTTIGYRAFYGCLSLIRITIGYSVDLIGNDAFENCSSLTSITCLAVTPPTTSRYTFHGVTSQATLYVPEESVAAYQTANNWKDFSQIIGIPTIDDFEVEGVWYRAIDNNSARVISKPDEDDLYSGDVVIPEEVIYECYPFSVVGIDEGAFEDCFELNSVVIGDAVESIGENAFQGCTDLTSVTIGSGVTTIGAKAFNYCNALQTVTCRGTVPPVMASSNCFTNATYNRATLIVPRQYIDTYAAADYWYKFSHIEGWGSAGMGDANGDGYITISDVTAIINILLTDIGIDNPDADLNHTGDIDIGDVTTLIHILLTQ